MTKIKKAINLLKNRLPKSYWVDFKIYENIFSMMRSIAKEFFNNDYKKCINWYNEYLNNPEKATYKRTKYFNEGKKSSYSAYDIVAICSNPIRICSGNLKENTLRDIIFICLHELGHRYYQNNREDLADDFAIRWCRRLIKEGLI